MSLRLVFMGTPDFAVPALAALLAAGHDVAAVYSQPPRPAGRGQREQPSPVHAFAAAKGIEVRVPVTLKTPEAQAAFAALGADAGVVAAYGLILPKPILEAPRLGCLNIHASLLPRWRGAAPIHRAVLAGDRESGVTIMQMDEGLDTGAMLLREAIPLTPGTTAASLHDSLAEMGARLIVTALDGLEQGELRPVAQPVDGVTYARKLSKDEGKLEWGRPAAELERMVRGLNPWPGVWFDCKGERIKVIEAAQVAAAGAAGTVLDEVLTVACGEDALRLLRLQRPGRAAMDAAAFLRGFPLPRGTRL